MPAKQRPNNTGMDLATRIAINKAPAWRPNVGDILVAKLVGVRVGMPQVVTWDKDKTPEDFKYPVLVGNILDENKNPTGQFVALHCFHTLIREAVLGYLKSGDIAIGEPFVASYLGKRNEEDEQRTTYHDYYVEPGDGSNLVAVDSNEIAEAFGF